MSAVSWCPVCAHREHFGTCGAWINTDLSGSHFCECSTPGAREIAYDDAIIEALSDEVYQRTDATRYTAREIVREILRKLANTGK